MNYVTLEELKRMMIFSYERIEREKEEINKINVFPVPDQDTGNNAAHTLLGIKEAISGKKFKNLDELSDTILDGALTAAHGNTGVIYTGFLAGFLSVLKGKDRINSTDLARAFLKGAERARSSIQDPKEGTILDVIDAVANVFLEESKKESDIPKIFKKATKKANEALLATREKMEILKKANVVDAGGLAYLMILESQLESLEGDGKEKIYENEERLSEKVKKFIQTISYRYEVVFLVKNRLLDKEDLENRLSPLGDSLEVLKIGDKTKVHIHTDLPDEVKKIANESGDVQSLRIEDLAEEVADGKTRKVSSVGIVVDDAAAVLPKILERYHIDIVPMKINWLKSETTSTQDVCQRINEMEKNKVKILPRISQVTSKDYLKVFNQQLKRFDKVLYIGLGSRFSNCYNSAEKAKKIINKPNKVFILDSSHIIAGEALLVLRAIELIQEGKCSSSIIRKIQDLILKTKLYIALKNPKWIKDINIMTKSQIGWVRKISKIGFYSIVTVEKDIIVQKGAGFGKDIPVALFRKVEKESRRLRMDGKKVRVVINYTDNLKSAERLRLMFKQKDGFEVSFISPVSPVICIAVGPEALIVGWQPIE